MAGIFSLAWKIFRGAEVASRKMVTVGGVADKLESEEKRMKKKRLTTPKILESCIFMAPMFMNRILIAPAEF